MNYNDDELQKELKELKASVSLDPDKKESMKAVIRKHARKKRKQKKLKQSAIWFSTAAAFFIGSILLFNSINDSQSVLPADNHNQMENTGNESKEPADAGDKDDTTDKKISVNEQGTETQTIMLEGMEEEVTVTNYVLEPYGIQYQMEEFLGNYTVSDNKVRHYSDAETAYVTMEVIEKAKLDKVVSDLQTEYNGDYDYTEEPAETSQNETPYQGMRQHFAYPPQGYYAYQIDKHVIVIQYEYVTEAGDGMESRLQVLRESISK
ncbi:hypothetical protein [Virgibacillus doumboii]|uniref:hypothetical protein n=1 Tax=Virgibacillus doumboii TaxID=2697503 RepID=UPI0013E03BA1|nr:hypothetical protein [Virgibacillus doumboii]